jgi:hypothetical protein
MAGSKKMDARALDGAKRDAPTTDTEDAKLFFKKSLRFDEREVVVEEVEKADAWETQLLKGKFVDFLFWTIFKFVNASQPLPSRNTRSHDLKESIAYSY